MTLAAGTRLGRYEVRSKIGAGGMGEVYLAHDTSELGRMVALKIVSTEVAKDKDRLQRFTQEARTVSNLNHPNILTIYEFGQTDAVSFIATEFVDGVTLREHLSSRRLKLIDVLDVAIQIVGALNAAHEAGVTHRDLKPENVMIRKDHIVKVLDFGLAKLAQPPAATSGSTGSEDATRLQANTTPGLIMGTVSYMSPEQSVGGAVDQRTDIWSAGVVLYEMIAGCVPFQGKDIHRQIIAIQEQEAPPLSQQVEGVPERLEEIVLKCLAKEKEERYQTVKDLLIDLRNLRRKLDVDAEIERNVAPAFRSTSAGQSASNRSAHMSSGTTTSAAKMSTASSAEYIVTGIKQHKLTVALAIVALVVGVVALLLYLRGRQATTAIQSIAVLPFVNQSGNADLEYLSDGMTDTLISTLSQLPNLNVKARSSVFRYKGKDASPQTIGKDLNVQAVLNGRIAQRGDQLTLTLELVDAQTENVIWSDQYSRKQADLVSLQSDIARDVSTKLKTKLSGVEEQKIAKTYTANPEAYQLYLKGLFHWNKRTAESLKTSVDYFNQAIEKDPSYAQAYAGKALAYVLYPQYSAGKPAEAMPKGKAAAMKALELDETLAEAHTALAQALFSYERNIAESDREYQRAIELNPNYATAHQWYAGGNLVATGRFDQAITEGRRAVELDPLSLIANVELSAIYGYARQNDQAVTQLRKVIELDPNWYLARMVLCQTYSYKGQFADAIAECEKARGLDDDPAVLSYLARSYVLSGKRDEAMKVVAQMHELARQRYVPAYGFGFVYAALGDKDQAFQWLERSLQDGGWEMTFLKVDPALDSLRSDPRFADLVRRVGL
jgi:eukaryotic-like serine/threonine-protein kinase